ncbi:hypothetical protein PIB30_024389 [Stylosanthes scabra]|uniref:Glycine-rich protein n=1 Tax=Stylosanthes scabra TaxID=79078 RepID=A0ABU6S995_9FABA|nr:hypothetical protein [Stylosanthes scabra]
MGISKILSIVLFAILGLGICYSARTVLNFDVEDQQLNDHHGIINGDDIRPPYYACSNLGLIGGVVKTTAVVVQVGMVKMVGDGGNDGDGGGYGYDGANIRYGDRKSPTFVGERGDGGHGRIKIQGDGGGNGGERGEIDSLNGGTGRGNGGSGGNHHHP